MNINSIKEETDGNKIKAEDSNTPLTSMDRYSDRKSIRKQMLFTNVFNDLNTYTKNISSKN